MKFVTYIRVSTKTQGESGLGLEAQRASVIAFAERNAGVILQEFVEVESGKRADRPELRAAMELAKREGAKLVIAKLDRLARDVAFISDLMKSGVKFVAVDMPDANDLTIHIIAAVAQNEAKAISDRTKAGLAALKARGAKLGFANPKRKADAKAASLKGNAVVSAKAKRDALVNLPMALLMRENGATLAQIADQFNASRIPTPRGARWSHVTIARMLKHADSESDATLVGAAQ